MAWFVGGLGMGTGNITSGFFDYLPEHASYIFGFAPLRLLIEFITRPHPWCFQGFS
jgi:hypothetical protein